MHFCFSFREIAFKSARKGTVMPLESLQMQKMINFPSVYPLGYILGFYARLVRFSILRKKKSVEKRPENAKRQKKAWQLPTFPPKGSIIGVRELDFRVRYGNGYYLSTMATRHLLHCKMLLYQAKKQATTQLKDE